MRALQQGRLPEPLPASAIATTDWKVPPVPEDLRKPGIEISGPCSITSMFINALNPGPEGERAEGDLDDDEDSGGHRLIDTVRACAQPAGRGERELHFRDRERNREYRSPRASCRSSCTASAACTSTSPTSRWTARRSPPPSSAPRSRSSTPGRAQAERGQGIYFYLPKLGARPRSARGTATSSTASREQLPFLQGRDDPRASPSSSRCPRSTRWRRCSHALGPYAAGLNAARWDLKASIFEFVMADPKSVWPDRFGVDIKTTPFLANIFRRLVAVCLKHGAVPIGGMATALPNPDPEVNRVAARVDPQATRSGRPSRASSAPGSPTSST